MKLYPVICKSLKEQWRSYWLLLLSLSMGPFFIFIYYLIISTTNPEYKILIVNNDSGITNTSAPLNYGTELIRYAQLVKPDSVSSLFTVKDLNDKNDAIELLRSKQADALMVIDCRFSESIVRFPANDQATAPQVELIGDLTSTRYLMSAVWMNAIVTNFTQNATQSKKSVEVKETALGTSASVDEFSSLVPGILIVSLIMLMFTASISFVSEVENKTILRLKLSQLAPVEFLGGISVVQLMIGIVSVLLTLITAILLGFNYAGSLAILVLVACLTSLSIISFSLIIAAITKSANEVLVVGNFPMFLFMFFTGAAFPLHSHTWFTIAGYPISLQGLLSPTHAISALNKTLILDMDLSGIIPEILSILMLTLVYFLIGAWLFYRRHLKLE